MYGKVFQLFTSHYQEVITGRTLGSGTRKYHLKKPFAQKAWYHVAIRMFEVAHAAADKIAKNIRRTFVILQPFGCLPNHVVGRGISKKLREIYPDVQILPMDYDPDVSFANLENRLQMLIMRVKEQETQNEMCTKKTYANL